MLVEKEKYNKEWIKEELEKGSDIDYIFFWGHTSKSTDLTKSCFSQWSNHSFIINSITYSTAEHWMMANKALLFKSRNIYESILNEKDPKSIKQLGREIINFSDLEWNKYKYEIVKIGNFHKFNQNPKLKEFLLNTKDKIIVEASPSDSVWGIGLSEDQNDKWNVYSWPGKNLLGFALMEIRDKIKYLSDIQLIEDLEPPWIKYPRIDQSDLFWRMGAGESYFQRFLNFYLNLNEKEKMMYRYLNPEPFEWTGVY
jgi:ribA/ribD-fused uncharacterized protein